VHANWFIWTDDDYHQLILTLLVPYLYTSKNIHAQCSGIAVCCAVKNNHKFMHHPWTAFICDHFCYHIMKQYFATITSCMSIVVIVVRVYFFLSFSKWIPFIKTVTVILFNLCCVMIHILWVIFNFSCHESGDNLSVHTCEVESCNAISSHFHVIGYCIWNIAIFPLRHMRTVFRDVWSSFFIFITFLILYL
jgi:hypothetical protein